MTKMKKILSVICVVSLLMGALSCVALAAQAGVDYTITNPYDGVDWNWKQYKTDLHSHTSATDGNNTLKEMVEEHYKYGYDILAISDHGTTSYSWTEECVVPALKVFCSLKRPGPIEVLDENGGYAANGLRYNVRAAEDTEYYYQLAANGEPMHEMMRVPYAIEHNPTSLNNAHVNSWFADYGNGNVGGTSDYETPISNIDALGGLSVINHPGEYSSARDEDETADAYNYDDTHYKYVIDKFTNLLKTYPSCIGIDVNSKGDSRTRYDRKLWDILLMNVVPSGRNVYAIGSSDAHNLGIVYSGYVSALMPDQSVESLKNCLANGRFFACSKYIGNPEEITDIANTLALGSDEKSLALSAQLLDMQAENAKAKYEAPKEVDAPVISSIDVDDDSDVITINHDGLCVRWIADGKTIATGDTINLRDYSDEIGSYVRAEVFGEGGIVYTQAFMLEYNGSPNESNGAFVDLWVIASIIPDTIVRFIAELPLFDVIWGWMQ